MDHEDHNRIRRKKGYNIKKLKPGEEVNEAIGADGEGEEKKKPQPKSEYTEEDQEDTTKHRQYDYEYFSYEIEADGLWKNAL